MDDAIFDVGLVISIETFYKYYLTTHLIGWEQGQYLITGIVQSEGKTGQVKVNDHCKMRFMKEGIAYGFETKIISINFKPFPIMFCQYPKEVEHFAVRKFTRIKVSIPAQFLQANGNVITAATVTDISAGGCGLTIPTLVAEELSAESTYQIAFNLMDSDVKLSCVIRKMRPSNVTHMLGIEFINLSSKENDRIKLFLDIAPQSSLP